MERRPSRCWRNRRTSPSAAHRRDDKQDDGFLRKQENTTQLVLGGVIVILSIFLAPLIYFVLGLHGGKSIAKKVKRPS